MFARRCVLFLSIAVLSAACGPPPKSATSKAPPFDLANIAGGGRTSLASFQGKVVVVDFWATWCPPCIKEIPEYTEFYNKNKSRGVEMVGVVFDSGEATEIQKFLIEKKVAYPQLLGPTELLEKYAAGQGYPTTFVIGKTGDIVKRVLGSPPGKFGDLQKAVDEALAAN